MGVGQAAGSNSASLLAPHRLSPSRVIYQPVVAPPPVAPLGKPVFVGPFGEAIHIFPGAPPRGPLRPHADALGKGHAATVLPAHTRHAPEPTAAPKHTHTTPPPSVLPAGNHSLSLSLGELRAGGPLRRGKPRPPPATAPQRHGGRERRRQEAAPASVVVSYPLSSKDEDRLGEPQSPSSPTR